MTRKYVYLVMECVEGVELFKKIAGGIDKTFNEDEAAGYMKKLFQALNHMNAQGIAHRDIKPSNIIVNEEGEVKLIDFSFLHTHCFDY